MLSYGLNVNQKYKDDTTLLYVAAFHGDVEICKFLISQGTNIDAQDTNEGTALEKACLRGNHEVARLLKELYGDISSKLTENVSELIEKYKIIVTGKNCICEL